MIDGGMNFVVTAVLSVGLALCAAALVFFIVRYLNEKKTRTVLRKENALLNERVESMSAKSSVKIQIFARLSQLLASSFDRTYLFKQIISVLTHYYPKNAVCAVLKDEDDTPVVLDMHSSADGRTVQTVSFSKLIKSFSDIQEHGGAKTAEAILDDVLLPQSLTNYIYPFALLTEEKIQGYLVVSQKSPIAPDEHLFFTDTASFLSSALQNVKTTNERDFINEQFGRSVDEKVRDYLLTHSDGGSIQSVSVMFFDIRNFTTLSEKLGPVKSVSLLNEIFSRCDEIIRTEGGFINKFTGDGFMAVFGAPIPSESHPVQAVRAALAILSGIIEVDVGIGIASGDALAGTIGSAQRKEYTVIGDTVNTASRVEGLCKVFGSHLVVTKQTFEPYRRYLSEGESNPEQNLCSESETRRTPEAEAKTERAAQPAAESATATTAAPSEKRGLLNKALGETMGEVTAARTDEATATTAKTRFLGTIRLKGKLDHVDVYDLASIGACYTADYTAAIESYYAKDFSRAETLFDRLKNEYPTDKAVLWYAEKCAARKNDGAAWDGVEQMTEK